MTDATPVSTPEDPNQDLSMLETEQCEKVPYRHAVGCLMFLATVSRPDISHSVGVVSRYLNNHSKAHWLAVKRIIRSLINIVSY